MRPMGGLPHLAKNLRLTHAGDALLLRPWRCGFADVDLATARIEKAPEIFSGAFSRARADQAWLGFFILALLVFFLSEATFLAAFFFFAFFGVVCSVCACAFVISGTVEAATNESRANAVMSAFITSSWFGENLSTLVSWMDLSDCDARTQPAKQTSGQYHDFSGM
jgi:hypothetical protein